MFLRSSVHLRCRTAVALRPLSSGLRAKGTAAQSKDEQSQDHPLLRHLKKFRKTDFAEQSVSTKIIVDGFKNMLAYREVTHRPDRVDDFKSALRAMQQLMVIPEHKDRLTFDDISKVVPAENGVSWRLLHELSVFGEGEEVRMLDEQGKAEVQFARVHNIGPAYAKGFAENGARTLDDLLKSGGTEYGRKVSKSQKIGIEHFDDMEKMIPRDEVDKFKAKLEKAFSNSDPDIAFEIMGSYRRGEPLSSDIDLVIYHPSVVDKPEAKPMTKNSFMGKIKTILVDAGLLSDDKCHSLGTRKIIALTRLDESLPYRQIDIRLCPTKSVPYMLLGNTGDSLLMKILRAKALRKKWVLNEYGMGPSEKKGTITSIKPGEEIEVKDEKEIFKKLGKPYLAPHERSFKVYSSKSGYTPRQRESPNRSDIARYESF